MSSVFEHKAFKWGIVGGSFILIFAIISGFFFNRHLDRVRIEQQIAQKQKEEWNYQEKFRSAMYRIRQNLKLEHFLAAYKNLDTLPVPKESDQLMMDEYIEVLNRIGKGLLANHLLKESEEVFRTVRNYDGQIDQASESLSRIESKRNLDSARLHYSQGAKLFEQKRYRDAAAELQKADVELNSVQSLNFDDIKEDKEKVAAIYREARFFINLDDAELPLREAEQFLKLKDFKKTQTSLSKANQAVSRAAFIHPDAAEVKKLRQRILDIDAEMGYLLPNATPIFNAFVKEMVGKTPHYFYLMDYEFTPTMDKDRFITLGIKFQRDQTDPYFVIRYRIYFQNGRDVFNGHFIMPSTSKIAEDGIESITYKQEIPEFFWNVGVRQMEIKIFDSHDVMVSQVSRAFRRRNS
ncbi:MAG: hypothetical protein J0L93_01945 [Deltaproteobacteria bacterium]|nr:hypothetical protein [Deltaproteobacteria bacterium]